MGEEIWVDEDLCISCGICIGNLPNVFRYADSGKAECFDPQGADKDDIQSEAIDACPVQCIHWR